MNAIWNISPLPGQEPRNVRDASRVFELVYLYKLLYDSDRLEAYAAYATYVDEEADIDACLHALDALSDAVWGHYSDYSQTETMYFSHWDIMEYYRLCRVYGKRFGVKLRDNPYCNRAEEYVRSLLHQPGCYTCSYHLQTKVNHQWASGIVFRMSPEFYGHFVLVVLLCKILNFYGVELQKLRAELDSCTAALVEKEAA